MLRREILRPAPETGGGTNKFSAKIVPWSFDVTPRKILRGGGRDFAVVVGRRSGGYCSDGVEVSLLFVRDGRAPVISNLVERR
mmetsp:Transcript_4119/g.8740  ORF Transcript_4119/g.8740 Transcript_4119/m.8740 type:complete len:83 (-) Transcript_4119:52-300(-)